MAYIRQPSAYHYLLMSYLFGELENYNPSRKDINLGCRVALPLEVSFVLPELFRAT